MDEVRIKVHRVALDSSVRGNGMFPKFVVIDEPSFSYRAYHSPDSMAGLVDGTYVYEPIEYYPYVFNNFFYSKNDTKTRLFYVSEPSHDSVTWGSYVTRFGTPITFG